MSKKGCCSCNVTSCCAPHNYTNNVAMIGDLLVDKEFELEADGTIKQINGQDVLIDKCQVYPVHKDDELILFQTAYQGDLGNNSDRVFSNGSSQCLCCYGYSRYKPQRSQTIRQKYKYIGCSWVWYPPKYLFNYDQNIPQCGIAYEKATSSQTDYNFLNCFEYATGFGGAGYASGFEAKDACAFCTQINPMLSNADFGVFDSFGNLKPNADPTVSAIQGVKPLPSGWHTQFTATLYPGHGTNVGEECCSCRYVDPNAQAPILPDYSTSCWKRTSAPAASGGQCEGVNYSRLSKSKFPLLQNGGYFYSTFEGRTRGYEGSGRIKENQTFTVGEGTDKKYYIKTDLTSGYYSPSAGGYLQKNCTYCSLSPYLREIAHNDYPWAYELFCAGGGRNGAAKLYNFPKSFIKTGFFVLPESEGLYQEKISIGASDRPAEMEQWIEVLGKHTFYSQLVGMVQLEHYWHYSGVNKSDLDAAATTIPDGVPDPTSSEPQSVQYRWNYWKQRTCPKMFVLKSSATPLFTFDLVYAERIGIFDAFADPDNSNTNPDGTNNINGKMTVAKFLAYFSLFSNGYRNSGSEPPDGRGFAQYPPGCDDPGYEYVRIVKDIIDAMCEANIIGTRDHRPVIYSEIKQIIESGLQNGSSNAYYKPWSRGNNIYVTPSDFNKLKEKYYTPYGKMCTEKEMFPENGLDGLGKFAPIRKIIPPSIIKLNGIQWDENDWKANHDNENPPLEQPSIYIANTFSPDEVFDEGNKTIKNCVSGNIVSTTNRTKIQNLQFSKYYANGNYDANSPDYVNSQLFFRAIPGRWSFVKWAGLARGSWCTATSDPCSPYDIYGEGPATTGKPQYQWHSESIRTTLFRDDGQDDRYTTGYMGLCNGVNSEEEPNVGAGCNSGDPIYNRTAGVNCGYQGIAWDASGAPSTVRCTPVCTEPNDTCCSVAPCGCDCAGYADCTQHNIQQNGNSEWADTKSCKELFGINCCSCIGIDPNQIPTTTAEYIRKLIDERKCETCADECNFACPEQEPPNFTSSNGTGTSKNQLGSDNVNYISIADDRDSIFNTQTNSDISGILPGGGAGGAGGGGGGGGGGGNPCDCGPIREGGCVTLSVGNCDVNCGYNGFSYDNLSFVLTQNNYSWGKTSTVIDPDTGQRSTCSVCKCGGSNTCYVRFAGKVQNYLPNNQTEFYEPQESDDGNLFNLGYINIDTPTHYILPNSRVGFIANTLLNCDNLSSGCFVQPESAGDNFIECVCNNNNLSDLLCPGALVKVYKYTPGINGCEQSALWCGYQKSGRLILNRIYTSDILDSNYAYV